MKTLYQLALGSVLVCVSSEIPRMAVARENSGEDLKKRIQLIEARLQRLEESQSQKPRENADAAVRAEDP